MDKLLSIFNQTRRELRLGQGSRRRRLGLLLFTAAATTVVLALSVSCARPPAALSFLGANANQTSAGTATQEISNSTAEEPIANQPTQDTTTVEPSPTTPAPAPHDALTSSKVELRGGPDKAYDLLKVLPTGEGLTLLGKSPAGNWYMIRTSDGSDGWAPADLLKLNIAASSVPVALVPPAPSKDNALAPSKPASTTPPAPVTSQQVTGVGDSIMLGASSELHTAIGGKLDIDAAVGRQVSTAIDVLRTRKAAGQLGPIVVVGIGSNGPMSAKQFDDMMQSLSGAQRVVFVNLKVPRDWEAPNNAVIAAGVKRYPNTVLVDWHGASVNHPEYFWDDQLHPRPKGAQVYADLIAAAIKAP